MRKKREEIDMPSKIHNDALRRATTNSSANNEAKVIEEFAARGIAADEIIPRENVFTFNAWKAKGRIVKKGEKGVKLEVFMRVENKDWINEDGSAIYKTIRKFTTVFHISQTAKL